MVVALPVGVVVAVYCVGVADIVEVVVAVVVAVVVVDDVINGVEDAGVVCCSWCAVVV